MFARKLLMMIFLLAFMPTTWALTPTSAQIDQFRKLPKSQQEALARQYGIDINSLTTGGSTVDNIPVQKPLLEQKTNIPTQQKTEIVPSPLHSTQRVMPFGYDVLKGGHDGFTVVDDLPVPLDYKMGPGDEIKIQIFGKKNENLSLTIDREGSIKLPDLGPVSVSGQTFSQMTKSIASVIKQKMLGVDVSVSMGAMRTMQVYIVGEAVHPGSYNVNALTTITQALIASGGVRDSGSLRHIQLKRKGKVISDFDLYDLLLKGDTSKDVRLSSGDTLFIPTKNASVVIQGAVYRPAVYELKSNTSSIQQLIDLAGGAEPKAYLSRVGVRRTNSKGVEQFTLDLSGSSDRNFLIRNADEVFVSQVSDILSNAVFLHGDVAHQGAIRFTKGMKISDAIGSIDDGLKKSADLNYALLVREISKKKDIEVYQFSLQHALTDFSSKDNLLLQSNDQIFVFNNGLDIKYWFNNNNNNNNNNKSSQEYVSTGKGATEKLDAQTGAVVVEKEKTKLDVADVDDIPEGQRLRQSNREALLKPILERLKQQASYDSPAQLIKISGAVKFPGTYPLVKNNDVASVIVAAGGLTEDAYMANAELTSSTSRNDSLVVKHSNFSLKDALNKKISIRLTAEDSLIIKSQPDWQSGMVIDLQGEVKFPGQYTFRRGERIKDIIDRAGGFTQFAYPKGAVFSRERLRLQEAERIKYINAQLKQEISNMALRRQGSTSNSSPTEAMAIVDQLNDVQPVGRLVVDINKAMKGDKLANLVLEKGDKLFIPALNPVISVAGEVQFPSNHTFNPNLTIEQYIQSAGGTKRQADVDRIYIVKANGSVELPNNSFWFSRSFDSPLEAGDAIIVPINSDYLDGLSTLSTATQILYQIGVAWSAVKN